MNEPIPDMPVSIELSPEAIERLIQMDIEASRLIADGEEGRVPPAWLLDEIVEKRR